MKTDSASRNALFAIIVLITASMHILDTTYVYGHSSGSAIVNPRSYSIPPGQTLTQDIRICLLAGGNFTISNVVFGGNYSNWAKVEADLPIRTVNRDTLTNSIDIPVSITVPLNFTEPFAVVQTVVEIQTGAGTFPATAGIPVFIRESTGAAQNPVDCNFFRDVQTGITYGIVILIASGGALVALAYYLYRRSKKHSKLNKASSITKIISVLLIAIGSLLILAGLFLLVVQRIL